MTINRRNILTVLGLAAAATPAVAIERMDTVNVAESIPPFARVPGLMMYSPETQMRMAETLEAMAAAIRSGELAALQIDVHSTATHEEWMRHEVKFICELMAEKVTS